MNTYLQALILVALALLIFVVLIVGHSIFNDVHAMCLHSGAKGC